MFTGMIQWIGRLTGRNTLCGNERLTLKYALLPCDDLSLREAVPQNRAHLTVVHLFARVFGADVYQQIRDLLIRGRVVMGSWANLQRIVPSSSCCGGPLVSDHVDCQGQVFHADARAQEWRFPASSTSPLLLQQKKSACINTVSLTWNALDQQEFDVAGYSHPLEQTRFVHSNQNGWVDWKVDFFPREVTHLFQSQVA